MIFRQSVCLGFQRDASSLSHVFNVYTANVSYCRGSECAIHLTIYMYLTIKMGIQCNGMSGLPLEMIGKIASRCYSREDAIRLSVTCRYIHSFDSACWSHLKMF
jgi:hypothetical protein